MACDDLPARTTPTRERELWDIALVDDAGGTGDSAFRLYCGLRLKEAERLIAEARREGSFEKILTKSPR